jgi:hypothetical protein
LSSDKRGNAARRCPLFPSLELASVLALVLVLVVVLIVIVLVVLIVVILIVLVVVILIVLVILISVLVILIVLHHTILLATRYGMAKVVCAARYQNILLLIFRIDHTHHVQVIADVAQAQIGEYGQCRRDKDINDPKHGMLGEQIEIRHVAPDAHHRQSKRKEQNTPQL